MSRQQRTILIVEDSPEDQEVYRRYLLRKPKILQESPQDSYKSMSPTYGDYDYRIIEATLGWQGLELWQQYQPDLILLDYQLPDLNGLKFLEQLQAQTQLPFLPVIIVTGQGNEAIAVEAIKAGAQDYLVKGRMTPELLQTAVNKAIATLKLQAQQQQRLERDRIVNQITLVYEWDYETGMVERSQGLTKLLGYTQPEADNRLEWWCDRIHPEDLESVQNYFYTNISSDKLRYEYRVRHKNGDYVWVEDRAMVIRNPIGEIVKIIGTILDISDRKLVEMELRESEARFRQLAENIDAVFWINEYPTRKISYVSPAYQRLWGLNPHELCQSYIVWIELIHPDDRNRVEQAFQVKGITGDFDEEYRIIIPDGRLRWVRDRCFPITNQQGEVYRLTGITEDITERKQDQVKLQQQLAEIEAIYKNAPIGLNVLDTKLRFVRINQRLADINGYSIPEHIGRSVRELLPNIADAAEQVLYPILETGEPLLNVEIKGETPAQPGVERTWIESFVPLKNGDRITGISTVCEEITERKRSELKLKESEARLRTLANNISQLAWMADADGSLFWYNQRWFDYTGTTFEQMQGWGWQQVHHPEHVDRVVNHFRHCLQTGEAWEDTFPLRSQSGEFRWFLSRAIPIRNDQGKIERWFGTNTDITDLREAQEETRQSEARYRSLAELIPQMVWTANPDGELLDVNRRWSEFTGLSLAQVQTHGWQVILHPDDLPIVSQQWLASVQTGTYYQAEARIRRADGEYRWHLHQAMPQKNSQGQIIKWFGTATDIEAQKQLAVERDRILQLEQTARAEAERNNRIKDEFLAILSHELRSPLNPILGWVKLLQSRKFDAVKTAEALAIIERNAKLQTQLIEDLLDIAKILRGKLSLDVSPVNLAGAIESAIDTVSTAAVAKSIDIEANLPNIGQVFGDETRIQQIVWNLLSNAIKFTPKHGRVEITLQQIEDRAQITVQDTGKGINPEFLPHIFESFRQEDVSITRQHGGLGLGLAIVRYLVEAHGGEIFADSPGNGKGATFTVCLPLLNTTPETQNGSELPSHLNLNGIRILSVDDEPDSRDLIAILLSEYGATVTSASSATEALIALESFQPDLIISDIGMPNIDGYSLMQQIRSLPPEKGGNIPAIALTAYAGEADQQKALRVGFQQHLTKPIEPYHLAQAVSNLLSGLSIGL